jgi:hypothetical protein
VNEYLQGSQILKFCCEEFIVALVSSQAKKSYIRLDIVSGKEKFEDVYAKIINKITTTDENGVK